MSDFVESRPQRLCIKCGKCCRLIADVNLLITDNDLRENLIPYSSIEEARAFCPETVDNILDSSKYKNIVFYKCKFISDENLCQIYGKRPQYCQRFPDNAWSILPVGCGFKGWLFQKREEIKAHVRKQKEIILEIETKLKTNTYLENKKQLFDKMAMAKKTIEFHSKYGSEDW